MSVFHTKSRYSAYSAKAVHEIEVSLVVIRADGTAEDLGVTDYYHRNPIRRWAFYARRKLGIRKEASTL
jgi:hypothetical protein